MMNYPPGFDSVSAARCCAKGVVARSDDHINEKPVLSRNIGAPPGAENRSSSHMLDGVSKELSILQILWVGK